MSKELKIGVLREGKNPPDQRVVMIPEQVKAAKMNYPSSEWVVQRSEVRRIEDHEYEALDISMATDMSDCDVLLGVKEVPINELIPNKTYFFFSHTIKEQPYNRGLLRAVLEKNIRLIDWETLVNNTGHRIIGFGRYAGIVGAYNGMRAWGLLEGTFELKKAVDCRDQDEMNRELSKVVLPPMRIVLTGGGRVGRGAVETLEACGIRKVSVDEFFNQTYDEACYVQLDAHDYNERIDGSESTLKDFYQNYATDYQSSFMKFAARADMFIAGHFHAEGAPYLFTRDDAKRDDFNIRLVADISCDIDGPVASTIRPSTIDEPLYAYDAQSESEVPFGTEGAIQVMAVDNLPCELPRDASRDFGSEFSKHVLPALFNNDKDGVLARATMAEGGKLTPRFSYLSDFVAGN